MEKVDKPYYVILTGSKNNAGDFLIKYRAKALFDEIRPDRSVVDFDAWKPLTDEQLEVINSSKALILMGGPSLQKAMCPNIYPLRNNLSEIKVPITAMGIGWKSLQGKWANTRDYSLNDTTKELLKRIDSDRLKVSVRDYHTLNILNRAGVKNGVMTGCPATYLCKEIGLPIRIPNCINKVGFSLGVSFLSSPSMRKQMKNLIKLLSERFGKEVLEVVFHHSLNTDFLKTHNATEKHLQGHTEFADWLIKNEISYVDISGSAENLIDYYSQCDLHIGYRVHAHIFMNSISKPSFLIAEDGRGKALKYVFGSVVSNAFEDVSNGFIAKVKRKVSIGDTFKVYKYLAEEIMNIVDYEINNDFPRSKVARSDIDNNYHLMNDFMKSLP